jgi:hypothetical protein
MPQVRQQQRLSQLVGQSKRLDRKDFKCHRAWREVFRKQFSSPGSFTKPTGFIKESSFFSFLDEEVPITL